MEPGTMIQRLCCTPTCMALDHCHPTGCPTSNLRSGKASSFSPAYDNKPTPATYCNSLQGTDHCHEQNACARAQPTQPHVARQQSSMYRSSDEEPAKRMRLDADAMGRSATAT